VERIELPRGLVARELRTSDMDCQALLAVIKQDNRYHRNIDWGEPRPGHPEGAVRMHIAELERGAERFRHRLPADDFCRLHVLIHVHDTFKAEAEEGVAITNPQSHASLARAYLAGFTDDEDLLAMVQFHDEPYALWRQVEHHRRLDQHRFDALLAAIHNWDLFLAFLIVDGSSDGKSRAPLRWFCTAIAGRVKTTVGAGDIEAGDTDE
jgi:hypothetical protein